MFKLNSKIVNTFRKQKHNYEKNSGYVTYRNLTNDINSKTLFEHSHIVFINCDIKLNIQSTGHIFSYNSILKFIPLSHADTIVTNDPNQIDQKGFVKLYYIVDYMGKKINANTNGIGLYIDNCPNLNIINTSLDVISIDKPFKINNKNLMRYMDICRIKQDEVNINEILQINSVVIVNRRKEQKVISDNLIKDVDNLYKSYEAYPIVLGKVNMKQDDKNNNNDKNDPYHKYIICIYGSSPTCWLCHIYHGKTLKHIVRASSGIICQRYTDYLLSYDESNLEILYPYKYKKYSTHDLKYFITRISNENIKGEFALLTSDLLNNAKIYLYNEKFKQILEFNNIELYKSYYVGNINIAENYAFVAKTCDGMDGYITDIYSLYGKSRGKYITTFDKEVHIVSNDGELVLMDNKIVNIDTLEILYIVDNHKYIVYIDNDEKKLIYTYYDTISSTIYDVPFDYLKKYSLEDSIEGKSIINCIKILKKHKLANE